MTCLIKYVFQICVPEDLNHANVNVNLMVESAIQNKNEIMINTN